MDFNYPTEAEAFRPDFRAYLHPHLIAKLRGATWIDAEPPVI